MQIKLFLAQSGEARAIPVLIENTLSVSRCALLLANHFGYPARDSAGTPLTYLLFSADGSNQLPEDRSLADLQVNTDTCLRLESVEARNATIPIAGTPPSATPRQSASRRWTRRSFVAMTSVCAVTGLGSGWTAALASQVLAPHGNGSPTIRPSTQLTLSAALHFTNHQKRVRTVLWSPDGALLASGGDDAQTLVWTPDGLTKATIMHQAAVQSLAWSPESQRLITGAGTQVGFYSALTGRVLALREHAAQVTSVAWTGQGQMQAASGSADTRVIVWQPDHYLANTIFARHTTAIQAITFSADGQTIGSSSTGGAVRVWTAANGDERHPWYLDTRLPVFALAFAPVGAVLAAGGSDAVIRLRNGLHCQRIGGSDQGVICIDPAQHLQRSNFAVRSLAWSPDASYLASGDANGTLTLWRPAQSQNPVFTITVQPNSPIHGIAWAPDGKRLATAVGTTIILWNLTGM